MLPWPIGPKVRHVEIQWEIAEDELSTVGKPDVVRNEVYRLGSSLRPLLPGVVGRLDQGRETVQVR